MSPTVKMPAIPAAPAAPQAPKSETGPLGQKPKQKNTIPSFLGTDVVPGAGQMGQKTLLGQ